MHLAECCRLTHLHFGFLRRQGRCARGRLHRNQSWFQVILLCYAQPMSTSCLKHLDAESGVPLLTVTNVAGTSIAPPLMATRRTLARA